MKKRLLMIFLFISLVLVSLNFVFSQDIPGNIPGSKLSGSLGEIDPNTGLPEKFSDFKEKADLFKTREQDNDYLKKEWTKIFAKNKFISPVLFYTHKFFSFFNPLWKFTFGVEFSWSWFFFVALGLWIVLIIVAYYPLRELLNNSLFGLIGAVVIASIIGTTGVISNFIEIMTPFVLNIWILIVLIIIVGLLVKLYTDAMKSMVKESDKEELKRAKMATKSRGKLDMEALGKYSTKK